MKETICIVCPRGCRITLDEGETIKGAGCSRGQEYAMQEFTNPLRTLTSTVVITGSKLLRLPVKTDKAIPKGLLLEAMKILNTIKVNAPVKNGDILIENILNTGANLIATRDIP